ncbi:hypothetical protein LCGC14_0587220 [marine sediment metagenome]|uniref:VWFA domain-containing protein n=1 Tax=marine sediment metagenome TaxID=412755 RepID=A0A0F9U0R6_9ZZZZ
MIEITLFVDASKDISDKVKICQSNAEKLGLKNGASIEVINSANNLKKGATIEVSSEMLDFAGQFAQNILDDLLFSGVELTIRPVSIENKSLSPTVKVPKIISTKPSQPPIESTILSPLPTPPPPQTLPPQPISAPQITPAPPPQIPPPQSVPTPEFTPAPQPTLSSLPNRPPPAVPEILPPSPTDHTINEQEVIIDQYPNKIEINLLQNQKNGISLKPVLDNSIEGGRIQLSPSILEQLGLGQGMLIAWEDPLTRAMGSARIDKANVSIDEIKMSFDTYEDTHIQSEQVVVYSTEPPIEKTSEIMLEVESQPNLMGYTLISPKVQFSLSIELDEILAFEDELTGAMGAGKAEILESVPDNVIIIDSEILEASGIGSFEVKVSKNQRTIIPLQNVSLGISPISGENMWEIISTARENIESMKGWISNYIIFKGIKLRWPAVNIACSILDTTPDLIGDIFAKVTQNTTISLSPTGLIPFNAILIIDISRSMMARDVLVTNIAPAIEGIKAAMESQEIQEFLKHFKDGIYIPRRISAAFAAILFLSEKVGRGFGEKVSIIRFADDSQVLPFGDSFYMDSASGKKGVLEEAARMIVDRIGNSYGQATNMGAAMAQANQILQEFQKLSPDQPNMVILLTDGLPTDEDLFLSEIRKLSDNPNVVTYILGLGNPEN